jgi:hypothetical protein
VFSIAYGKWQRGWTLSITNTKDMILASRLVAGLLLLWFAVGIFYNRKKIMRGGKMKKFLALGVTLKQ